RDLDLLLVDLVDVGARYYTYAATAVWAAEAALAAGCEVWVLDRPNPLGGAAIEGNLRPPGFESFVGAFALPVRHGLTLGELALLEAARRGWSEGLEVVEVRNWRRHETWHGIGRPWLAPSPNLPTLAAAWVYPGLCLIEGTTLSEGRGTTRPFQLVGAPGVDPPALAAAIVHPGIVAVPAYFRPQFHKHAGELCGGVLLEVVAPPAVQPVRLGVEVLSAFARLAPEAFGWREEVYEFASERPAIDLLSGGETLRRTIDDGGDLGPWLGSWRNDEERFRAERAAILLYD
ncbi:MAG: exo-beta-N-acetylmuramidase NamZ family protein, partial [Thermoanaerobaculia bacterium]